VAIERGRGGLLLGTFDLYIYLTSQYTSNIQSDKGDGFFIYIYILKFGVDTFTYKYRNYIKASTYLLLE
jgi:hypothetical protein